MIVALRCVALCCVVLRCVALRCVVMCCVVLCCVVLCCVVLVGWVFWSLVYGNRTATNRCIGDLFVCCLVRLETNLDVGFERVMWRWVLVGCLG